jgi:hypothetical protein
MITLTEFRKILNKKNDTSETKYLWKCYGQNAKFFDSENISLVFNIYLINSKIVYFLLQY